MKPGDWVILPSKIKRVIHIGEIVSELKYHKQEGVPSNYRDVQWLETDIPRSSFDQDLLYSFGAFMTVCRITRNNAEARIKAMAANGWQATGAPTPSLPATGAEESEETAAVDIETAARDQIAQLIIAQFQGHKLARLVDAVLKAQGYTTFVSPEGPDKGIDILAAPGPLGFGEPRICVQVKSSTSRLDRPTLDQLVGTMQNVHAQQGLLVSWGGFKSSVAREEAQQFFRVRLWDQDELIDQVLEHYDKLDDDLRTDLPLKRIWTVAEPEESSS
jgi:restriction system protein